MFLLPEEHSPLVKYIRGNKSYQQHTTVVVYRKRFLLTICMENKLLLKFMLCVISTSRSHTHIQTVMPDDFLYSLIVFKKTWTWRWFHFKCCNFNCISSIYDFLHYCRIVSIFIVLNLCRIINFFSHRDCPKINNENIGVY